MAIAVSLQDLANKVAHRVEYRKSEATFSDVLTMVSRVLWAEKYFMNSMDQPEPYVLQPEDWEILLDQLAATA
jgi:hypothetical protein